MKTGRKISGGKYHKSRKKKLYEKPGQERQVSLGETKRKQLKLKGGSKKTVMLKSNIVNLSIGESGKIQKTEIKNVIATPQNPFLARQNRLMKGSIIETGLGKARITNRPSQEGSVNAVLIKE